MHLIIPCIIYILAAPVLFVYGLEKPKKTYIVEVGEEKLRRIQPDYHLIMDIKLRTLWGRERKSYKGELPASAFKKEEKPQGKQNRVEDEDDDYDKGGRSPNDDRSDSMNPNNDSYQASMDNRSDQMNPNNDAYRSSRGR